MTKEHICRQCRFAGEGAAFLVSELLEAGDVDGPTGDHLPTYTSSIVMLVAHIAVQLPDFVLSGSHFPSVVPARHTPTRAQVRLFN